MLTPSNHHSARHRAQLTASDVTVVRGDTRVIKQVNLVASPTTRLAIVGENGRGKTTLLHVLAGVLTPDEGVVTRIGSLGLAEQEMETVDDRTVDQAVADAIVEPLAALAALDGAARALSENGDGSEEEFAASLAHAEALDAWDAERRVQVALEALHAETDGTRLLADLSVGQRYRVRLACLLGSVHDFLLLDEPTNHLDRSGLEFLTSQLRNWRGGVIVVSHDRSLLSDFATTVLDLDPTQDGRPRLYGDGYAGYRDGRQAERARWEQDYHRQQADHARLQESLSAAQNRLVSGWRPEKGTNKHGRATRAGGFVQNVHRRQEVLEAHAVSVPEPPLRFRFPDLEAKTGAVVLDVDKVTVDGRLTSPVSFSLMRRGRILITGPNGAGKSTLLSIASGDLIPATGSVRRSLGVRLGYLRQETALPNDRRVSDLYSTRINELVATGTLGQSDAIGLSELGLLQPREIGKRVGELSMGQQRRLDLALVLAGRPHVLLLDEPTNHLSIALVNELTEALSATPAAVIVSTHDRQLLRDLEDWTQLNLVAAEAPGPVIRTAHSMRQ